MATNQFLLYENAGGYALFQKNEAEAVAQDTKQAQAAIANYDTFSKMVKLVSFQRFESAESALEECNAVANGNANSMFLFRNTQAEYTHSYSCYRDRLR